MKTKKRKIVFAIVLVSLIFAAFFVVRKAQGYNKYTGKPIKMALYM